MKSRFFVAAASILVSAGIAHGADLSRQPVPAPAYAPAPVTLYDWTGLYLGVNGGYAWGNSRYNFAGLGSTGAFGLSGGIIGGTIGVNYQFGHIVTGLEGDLDWTNLNGSTTCPGSALTCQTSSDWVSTVRGRVGYAFDRFLPYVTGGLAMGNINANVAGVGSSSATNYGWTIGGGMEYALTDHWSAKVEYLHNNLGSMDCGLSCSITPPARVRLDEDTVRAGINYKFNWGR
jgi:outer membrane immunogenic protein